MNIILALQQHLLVVLVKCAQLSKPASFLDPLQVGATSSNQRVGNEGSRFVGVLERCPISTHACLLGLQPMRCCGHTFVGSLSITVHTLQSIARLSPRQDIQWRHDVLHKIQIHKMMCKLVSNAADCQALIHLLGLTSAAIVPSP